MNLLYNIYFSVSQPYYDYMSIQSYSFAFLGRNRAFLDMRYYQIYYNCALPPLLGNRRQDNFPLAQPMLTFLCCHWWQQQSLEKTMTISQSIGSYQ